MSQILEELENKSGTSWKFSKNKEKFINEIIANKGLQQAVTAYWESIEKKDVNIGTYVSYTLRRLMDKYNIQDRDLSDLLLEAGIRIERAQSLEQAIIEYAAKTSPAAILRPITGKVSVSKKKGITNVWRKVDSDHVFAIKWDNTGGSGKDTGTLSVVFKSGGGVKKTKSGVVKSSPLYEYYDVSYNAYYRIWKSKVSSIGRYINNTLARQVSYVCVTDITLPRTQG